MCLNSVCVCRCWCCDCYWYVKNVDLARITLLFVYISVNYQSVKLIWRREERSATIEPLIWPCHLTDSKNSNAFVEICGVRTNEQASLRECACLRSYAYVYIFIYPMQSKNRSDTVCQWHIHTLMFMSFGVFFLEFIRQKPLFICHHQRAKKRV